MESQIREALDIRPRTNAIKKVFWELLGFDPVRDSLGPSILALPGVKDLEIFACLEDFPVMLVTFEGRNHWGPAQVDTAWEKIRQAWPSCLMLATDSARSEWILAGPSPGNGRVIQLPIFKDKAHSARSLAQMILAADGQDITNALEIEYAFGAALDWRRTDAILEQWTQEHSRLSQPSLHLWMETMKAWPLFTPTQERDTFQRLAKLWPMEERDGIVCPTGPARLCFEECVLRNLRLAAWLSYRYKWACGAANQLIDLLQEGVIGLMTAVQRFDVARELKFSTFGVWWIRQKITRYLYDTRGTIRVPVHVHEELRRLRRVERRLSHTTRSHPHPGDVAAALDVPTPRVHALYLLPRTQIRLNEHAASNPHNHLQVPPGALGHTQSEVALRVLRASIDKALMFLPANEAEIIRLRFGLNGHTPKTLQHIGELKGLTRERIRQLEKRAIERLGKYPLKRQLKPFSEESLI